MNGPINGTNQWDPSMEPINGTNQWTHGPNVNTRVRGPVTCHEVREEEDRRLAIREDVRDPSVQSLFPDESQKQHREDRHARR